MTPTPSENGSVSTSMPLRPALKPETEEYSSSPKSPKVVSIAEPEPLAIPPLELRQFNAGVGSRRLSGRPNMTTPVSSRPSLSSQTGLEGVDTSAGIESNEQSGSGSLQQADTKEAKHIEHHSHGMGHGRGNHGHGIGHGHGNHNKLMSDVLGWLQGEMAKRAAKVHQKRGGTEFSGGKEDFNASPSSIRSRTGSMSSDSSAISLEKLQRILEDNMNAFGHESLPTNSSPTISARSPSLRARRPSMINSKRKSSVRKYGFQSSDTEYQDGDVVVPSCDVVLDNSKTVSYPGGGAGVESSDTTVTLGSSKRAEKERKNWLQFKSEIVRLAHTLRLKGWRKVPLESGGEIEVERLSGALTNAVYVVSPPKDISIPQTVDGIPKPASRPPPKLLLRIYGPQVEHLIDRENELGILRRLARKKIGPRLLGTFTNGRFEEFFNAITLKSEDLRIEDTSKQIARRMRELHDGIDLLDREREEGAFVWRNWDKWVDKCEEVITYLDEEILSKNKGKGEGWRERGLVCGVEWRVFKHAVDKYRKWLEEYYKKRGGVELRLVFAHNDTQYGNILRLVPPSPMIAAADGIRPPPSPLLLPQNHHKQLIVIDFEYASANTPGLEFANHFTEWCYNYHDPNKPWACTIAHYPTLEQQRRFIRSYVNHRPQFNPRASATPKLLPVDVSTSSIRGGVNEFLLDSRTPGSSSNLRDDAYFPRPSLSIGSTSTLSMKLEDNALYADEEKKHEQGVERQVNFLLEETRIWRVANSAQWVAWGIVQAKVPELDDKFKLPEPALEGHNDDAEEEEDEFDYLAYAQDRALFFWADVVSLGIVKLEELPALLGERIKRVE